MEWISGNRFLSLEEMQNNAKIIRDYFISKGWTLNAICGLLGNLQTESTINPEIWESLDYGNLDGGYGLVQWTPAHKYIEWGGNNYANGTRQLERIIYELENNLQWIATYEYPMSFKEFATSTESPYKLGMVFIANYERPFDSNQPIRGQQAEYWYNYLKGDTPSPPNPPSPEQQGNYLILRKYLYNNDDRLFGARFTSISSKAKLIKRVGDMVIIEVDRKRVKINYKNLKKL